jgi:hypothetical protein
MHLRVHFRGPRHENQPPRVILDPPPALRHSHRDAGRALLRQLPRLLLQVRFARLLLSTASGSRN